VFSSDLIDCEQGTLKNYSQTCLGHCEFSTMHLIVETPSCPGYSFVAFEKNAAFSSFTSAISPVKCMNAPKDQAADRIIIAAAFWSVAGTLDPFQALVCLPTYSIIKGLVSVNGDGAMPNIAVKISNSTDQSTPPLPNGLSYLVVIRQYIIESGYAVYLESACYTVLRAVAFTNSQSICRFHEMGWQY
jgi:hypothetical protein